MKDNSETLTVVILGASGGIGRAFLDYFLQSNDPLSIHATYHQNLSRHDSGDCHWYAVDMTQENEIKSFCDSLGEVDICINAIGMLHNSDHMPEKSTSQINTEYFIQSMNINALPTLLLAKYMAPKFRHKRAAVFATVSARVGSIEENYLGGWYSYRASKAALNMILKTLSIEWKRVLPNVVVSALHPGTTDTQLSAPFRSNLKPGQLLSPQKSVQCMMAIIDNLNASDSGKFWSFDGNILPW